MPKTPRRIANGNTRSWGTTRRNISLIRATLVITICLFAAETRSENKPASLPAPSQGNSLAVDKTESALLDELRTLEAQNPDSIEVTRDLDLLSWYYWTRGRFSLAEPLLIESLAIKEKTLNGDDPEIQENVDRLGYIYFWEGRFAEAEQLFDRALQNPSEADYTNPWLAGLAHNGLGWIYVDEGRQQEAESMLDEGLEIRRRTMALGSDVGFAYLLRGLAELYCQEGRFAEADALATEAVKKASSDPQSLRYGFALQMLADANYGEGRYSDAERLYSETGTILLREMGDTHLYYEQNLGLLGLTLAKEGKVQQALGSFSQSMDG